MANIIDPQTPIGKIRLRIGDWRDLPILPDVVIQGALDECDGNIPRAASLSAQYILGTLSAKTHRKLANIEVWGNEQFDNYVKFLKMTILNPHLMTISPLPYANTDTHPLIEFTKEWNSVYCGGQ